MMKRNIFLAKGSRTAILTALLMGVVAGGSIAAAQSPAGNIDPKAVPPADGAAALLDLSGDVLAWGRINGDPLALVVAASLLNEVGEIEVAPAAGEPGEAVDAISKEMILSEAREMVADDEVLLGLIDDVEEQQTRGRIGGEELERRRIEGGETIEFSDMFEAQVAAAVYVQGDGNSDLDLTIVDDNEIQICSEVSLDDREFCQFTPLYEGQFTIRVFNYGNLPNEFLILVN